MANGTLKRKISEDVSPLNAKKPHIPDKNGANETEHGNINTSLTDLPNEILGKVMDLLSMKDLFHLERVNKRMRDIALNVAWPRRNALDYDSLNYGINPEEDKTGFNNKVSEKMVESIFSRANIKHFDLSDYSHKINHQICLQLRLAPQLLKLDLCNIELNNVSLKNIAISCPLLEYASFPGCWRDKNLDDGLEFFFKRCPNLKYLNLSGNAFSDDSFAYIPTKIRYLNLYFCDSVTSKHMEFISKKANDLETLIIHNFKPTNDVNIWLKNFTKLRFLQISRLEKGNLPSLNLSHLQELEMLSLSENKLVTAETLKSLKHCTKLKGLDLCFNLKLDTSDALKELENCKALKYCDFSWLENFNDGLIDFVQNIKLEYLAINGCRDFPEKIFKLLIADCNSLSQIEALSGFYSRAFPSALSQKCIKRSNILKLFVENGMIPSNNLCEVVYSEWPTFFITHAIRDNKISL